jgi:hypothetical protein
MRIIYVATSLLLFYYPDGKSDVARQGLRGRVKSVTNCQCPVKKGKIDTAGCMVFVFKYREDGIQFEDDDYINGNIYKGFNELNHKRLYKYDEQGNQSEVDEYNPDGSVNQKVIYKYDGKGNRIERDNYLKDGRLWYRALYTFDENSRQVECAKYNADSELTEHYSYAYDAHGNLTMEQHTVAKAKEEEAKRSKITHTSPNPERMMDYIKTFVYDDSGKVISETDNFSDYVYRFETTYMYDGYDSAGNWTKQTTYEGGKAVAVAERVIDYY